MPSGVRFYSEPDEGGVTQEEVENIRKYDVLPGTHQYLMMIYILRNIA